jgi:hypothetical protein
MMQDLLVRGGLRMKEMRILSLVILLFMILANCCAAPAKPEKIKEDDFEILTIDGEKIAIFDYSIDPLVTLLGKPQISVVYENKDNPTLNIDKYSWDQISAEVFRDTKEINSLLLLGSKLKTKRGIQIGASVKEVRDKYGIGRIDTSEKIGYSLPTEESVWGISFYLLDGKVIKINLVREP